MRLAILSALFTILTLTTAKRGRNKPAKIDFTCYPPNGSKILLRCDEAHIETAIKKHCSDLGGDQLYNDLVNIRTDAGQVTGADAICLCAHGNAVEAKWYDNETDPPGEVWVHFGLGTTFGVCRKNG